MQPPLPLPPQRQADVPQPDQPCRIRQQARRSRQPSHQAHRAGFPAPLQLSGRRSGSGIPHFFRNPEPAFRHPMLPGRNHPEASLRKQAFREQACREDRAESGYCRRTAARTPFPRPGSPEAEEKALPHRKAHLSSRRSVPLPRSRRAIRRPSIPTVRQGEPPAEAAVRRRRSARFS